MARINPSASVRRDAIQLVFSFFWFAGVTFGAPGGLPVPLRIAASAVFAVLTVVPAVALARRFAHRHRSRTSAARPADAPSDGTAEPTGR